MCIYACIIISERSEAIIAHTVELSVDVDVNMDDVFDSRCRIGQMAGQITTRLGTVTLQVMTRVNDQLSDTSIIRTLILRER